MSDHEVKMIILSTDDLDESIRFYSETLGMALKFRDGGRFAALDGGPVTLALATAVDHPIPGQVVVGVKTADVDAAAKAVEASGRGVRQLGQRRGVLQPARPVKHAVPPPERVAYRGTTSALSDADGRRLDARSPHPDRGRRILRHRHRGEPGQGRAE
jgi:lactoylglutathione lyase